MKTNAYIASIPKRVELMDKVVSSYTGLTQEEVNEIRFDTAYEYLHTVIGTDAFGLEKIPTTPHFWFFWRKEWLRIDEVIFCGLDGQPPRIDRMELKHDWLCRKKWLFYHEAAEDNYLLNKTEIWHTFIKELTQKNVKH